MDPWFDWVVLGRPRKEKKIVKTFVITLTFLSGMASGGDPHYS